MAARDRGCEYQRKSKEVKHGRLVRNSKESLSILVLPRILGVVAKFFTIHSFFPGRRGETLNPTL